MQIDARLGSFDEVAATAGALAPVLSAVRALVEDVHPDALETASRKEQTITWSFRGGKMTGGYAYARAFSAHANLGFFQGAHLPDPKGILEGTGKTLRHVKLRRAEDVQAREIRDLIAAAYNERRIALNLN